MKMTFITCRRGQDTAFCLCHVRLQLLVLAPVMRAPGAASNALVSSYHNDLEALDMPLNFCRYIACVRRDNIVSLCCCSIIACPGAILVRFHFTDEPERLLTGSLTDWLSSDESRTTPFVFHQSVMKSFYVLCLLLTDMLLVVTFLLGVFLAIYIYTTSLNTNDDEQMTCSPLLFYYWHK